MNVEDLAKSCCNIRFATIGSISWLSIFDLLLWERPRWAPPHSAGHLLCRAEKRLARGDLAGGRRHDRAKRGVCRAQRRPPAGTAGSKSGAGGAAARRGRVFTVFDLPGLPEMGFNSMASGYGRGIDAAEARRVELYDVAPLYRAGGGITLFLDGKPLTCEQWVASPLDPFPVAFKASIRWEAVNKIVATKTLLSAWTEWADPKIAALDVPCVIS